MQPRGQLLFRQHTTSTHRQLLMAPSSPQGLVTLGPCDVSQETGQHTSTVYYGVNVEGKTILKWANDQAFQGLVQVGSGVRAECGFGTDGCMGEDGDSASLLEGLVCACHTSLIEYMQLCWL